MLKIRTIDRGYDEYKTTIDIDTSISRHDWRQIVITRKLKSVRRSGNRWLYDLCEMIEYLQNPHTDNEDKQGSLYGKLRRIGG